MPKAFNQVWHTRLIYKLESVGVSGDLLKLIKYFLNNRFQQALLNGFVRHLIGYQLKQVYLKDLY